MSRDRTHWEDCWRVHHECAIAKIERQSEADQRDAARYRWMRLAEPWEIDMVRKGKTAEETDAAIDEIIGAAMSAAQEGKE